MRRRSPRLVPDTWRSLPCCNQTPGNAGLCGLACCRERYAERFRLNVGVVDCATTLSQAVGGVATVLFCALSQKVLALRFRPGTGGAGESLAPQPVALVCADMRPCRCESRALCGPQTRQRRWCLAGAQRE